MSQTIKRGAMKIRTFWIFLLKIFGLWLLISLLSVFPQFVSAMGIFFSYDESIISIVYILAVMLIITGLYFILMRYLIFSANNIVDRLKLDQGFPEDSIHNNISSTMILTIATIIIGGIIFIDAVPMLTKQIFVFIQQQNVFRQDPQAGWILFYAVKAVIGYLLMTNSISVVNFITRKPIADTGNTVSEEPQSDR